ncbi:nuclear transport factor 2 family protein [Pseudohalioglobus sediminis]|uniref:Nuclear transport factor 2 family protein n=1 Tax=Pseudohalioglobus sediminis TaxID=2606449 RepID=A0A5B0WT54_9GAMM|nr:nuclear transport factor 2 family protein [Pseudohalioglobus sediminis]KAA1189667.1 nuclear transport factor 2 family protein [Pseudohalioglobus sediminis]
MHETLAKWHRFVATSDAALLEELIAGECVFLSPVVHTPQQGGDITRLYLTGAMHVLNDGFHYVKEVVSGNYAVLEFVCEVDGLQVNGVDIMTFDAQGKICEFKVMVRPLKALNAVHGKMRAMLEQLSA